MHIKRIELAGFKSYRDVTVVDNLSEGYNVIGACARAVVARCGRLTGSDVARSVLFAVCNSCLSVGCAPCAVC